MSASMTPHVWLYTKILQSETHHDVSAFLERALAWLARHGVKTERVMTDNGPGYRSKRFARAAVESAGARHIRTQTHTTRTNGKAERFIQSSLREWTAPLQLAPRAKPRRHRLDRRLQHHTTPHQHRRPRCCFSRGCSAGRAFWLAAVV